MPPLNAFCERFGLDASVAGTSYLGQHPHWVDPAGDSEYAGAIDMLRIEPYGRFGNRVYAILNALLIAHAVGASGLELPPVEGASALPLQIDGFRIIANEGTPPKRATLCGNFFAPRGLEQLTEGYTDEAVLRLLDRYVRPIYRSVLRAGGSLGAHVAAMHFRAGDIFRPGGGHHWYVQPPASYYIKAFSHAQRRLGVDTAHLVFEDRSNPCVDLVADHLSRFNIPFTLQSATVFEDLASVLSAHHLIAPFGTFCEAAALLSPVLETYTGFRSLSTQTRIEHWTQSRVGTVLRTKKVRTFLLDDPDASYIAPETWQRTEEQLELMRNYPTVKLRIMEKLRDDA
jgi:hypothetical protein